jgi:hypothetical protein
MTPLAWLAPEGAGNVMGSAQGLLRLLRWSRWFEGEARVISGCGLGGRYAGVVVEAGNRLILFIIKE